MTTTGYKSESLIQSGIKLLASKLEIKEEANEAVENALDSHIFTLRKLQLVKAENGKEFLWDGTKLTWTIPSAITEKRNRRHGRQARIMKMTSAAARASKLIQGVVRVFVFCRIGLCEEDIIEATAYVRPLGKYVGGESAVNIIIRQFWSKCRSYLHEGGERYMEHRQGTESEIDKVHLILGKAFGNSVQLCGVDLEYAKALCNQWVATYEALKNETPKQRRKEIDVVLKQFAQERGPQVEQVEIRWQFPSEQKESRKATRRRQADQFLRRELNMDREV